MDGVRGTRVWARLLGLGAAVVEGVEFGDEGEIVVAARPRWYQRDRCGVCGRRCPGFDLGEGRRRWRALDLGATVAYVEADAPRVTCREPSRLPELVVDALEALDATGRNRAAEWRTFRFK